MKSAGKAPPPGRAWVRSSRRFLQPLCLLGAALLALEWACARLNRRLERFSRRARSLGMEAVVLLLYGPSELVQLARGTDWHLPAKVILKQKRIAQVDTGGYIVRRLPPGFSTGDVGTGCRLNGPAQALVADALAAHLENPRPGAPSLRLPRPEAAPRAQ
jgi:hypothetical protein